jgi:excisionase family DNA binding protein
LSLPPDSERASKATANQERARRQHERRAKIAARLERMAYSVDEVSVALDLDPATVWRLVKSGEIPSVKIGGSRRIPAAWLKQRLSGQDTPER